MRLFGINTGKLWVALSVAVAAGLATVAQAQQDFPTYQGTPQRIGQNGNAGAAGPGQSLLNWYAPNGSTSYIDSILIDNTNPGAVAAGTWGAPTTAGLAGGYYGNYPNPYLYSVSVPSSVADPTVALGGYTLSTFTWTFTPAVTTPKDYAVSVNLPIGSTVLPSGQYAYPQRYFVYEIDYGTGEKDIEIVDRNATGGGGFVRLGNNGGSTTRLYHYDGVNPIVVKLYNTIPRDANGQLEGVALNAAGLPLRPNLVYADAAYIQTDYGSYSSSPVVGTYTDAAAVSHTQVFNALNQNVSAVSNGVDVTQQKGILQSFDYNTGNLRWTFSPNDALGLFTLIAPGSAGITADPSWALGSTAVGYQGTGYFEQLVTNNAALTANVTYTPTLTDGTYDIYLWLPGAQPPTAAHQFAHNVLVTVYEGATPLTYTVDLTQRSGYVRLGGQSFPHTSTVPLKVVISNFDGTPADNGLYAYADAVRFVGSFNNAITSTPTFVANMPVALPGGTITNKSVVIVAAEDGHIYCVDAQGNGDGTTTVYWAYPSIPNPNIPTWTDPNQVAGLDGVGGLAQMPGSFGKTSPIVIPDPSGSGKYFVYIGSSVGRVYCIDATGRGDGNIAQGVPGTTTRLWSFPNDYPQQAVASNLGSFIGSLAYANTSDGPTIFAPTTSGRLYALDAVGNPASLTTTARWTYPSINAVNLGPIAQTPAISLAQNQIYFGTERKDGSNYGVFNAVNLTSHALAWSFNGVATGAPASDFLGGPAIATAAQTGDATDSVFTANENGFVYALSPTGALKWQTDEVPLASANPLLFTTMNVYDNTGVINATASPVVVVPTDSGTVLGLFAGQSAVNVNGLKLAWGYKFDGDNIATGLATGYGYMYGEDNHGYLYAFNSSGDGNGGNISGPGSSGTVITANNPIAQAFAGAKIAFLTPAAYAALIQSVNPTYAQVTAPANFLARNDFDFGEMVYAIAYDFPYGKNGATSLQFNFKLNGSATALNSVEALQASGAPSNEDGYAIVAFPIEGVGPKAITPGIGSVSASYTLEITNKSGATQNAYFLQTNGVNSRPIGVANPIGIAMMPDPTNANYGLLNDSLGSSLASFANPASPENLLNGPLPFDPAVTAALGTLPTSLGTSGGLVNDGSGGNVSIAVYDRSLMAILNGPDSGGLGNVRVNRTGLAWQGGYASVVKPLTGANGLYPALPVLNGFEDLPVNYPNNSLDYPDISQTAVTVVKDPQGSAQDPLSVPVTLNYPSGLFVLDSGGNVTTTPVNASLFGNRTPNPTVFQLNVDVPAYQPANYAQTVDSLGNNINAGNLGTVQVFVDANNSGVLNNNSASGSSTTITVNNGQTTITSSALNSARADAYRQFRFGVGVPAREQIALVTPTIDLGSIAQGSGIFPNAGGVTAASVYGFPGLTEQPVIALNQGNVNLYNVRLAKATNTTAADYLAWPVFAKDNEATASLDGEMYVWSTLDPTFSPTKSLLARGEVFSMKPRPGDGQGTRIITNPVRRNNPNLGILGTDANALLNPVAFPPANSDPEVSVTPPIGFPNGVYSQTMRLIEDFNYRNPSTVAPNYDLSYQLGNETYSDPTFQLSFRVSETQLTNAPSPNTSPMIDNLFNPTNGSANGGIAYVDSNVGPTGVRDLYGNLLVGWSSNRPNGTSGAVAGNGLDPYRLYFANAIGTAPLQATPPAGYLGTPNAIADLRQFNGNGTSWFNLNGPFPFAAASTNPALANQLFHVSAGDHVLGTTVGEVDTASFANPTFSATGAVNPFDETQSLGTLLMAFTGQAQIQTAQGRIGQTIIGIAPVIPQQNGNPTIDPTQAVTFALPTGIAVSRPSIVQTANNTATLYYTAETGGQATLYGVTYSNGVFGQPVPIDLGFAFESVTGVTAEARTYTGANSAAITQTGQLVDLVISGRLRGHKNAGLYVARAPIDANGLVNSADSTQSIFSYYPARVSEEATPTKTVGTYAASGIIWNSQSPIDILVNGVSVLSSPTPVVDPATGYQVYTTQQGNAVVDVLNGTVRFVSGRNLGNSPVSISYQPLMLNLANKTGSDYTNPTLAYDNRLESSANLNASGQILDKLWFNPDGTRANITNQSVRHNRTYVVYEKANYGAKRQNSLTMQTLRWGLQVPGLTPITALNAGLTVNSTGPFEVDPADGSIYFTSADEDRFVTVTNSSGTVIASGLVEPLTERGEFAVPQDKSLNETSPFIFIDPFDPVATALRRPGLLWIVWNSTRNGVTDVFLNSVAPSNSWRPSN